jgi:signal transduction histidine kinase
MDERVCLVGGRLEITAAPGEGTELRVTLPARRVAG